MGMSVTTRIIEEGVRNLTMQFTGLGDGTENETGVVKVNVAALNPRCAGVRIMKATYDVAYGLVEIQWDALAPVDAILLDGYGHFDYCRQGGLNNSGVVGATGNILFSTKGFEANSSYTITLEMKKKGVPFSPV